MSGPATHPIPGTGPPERPVRATYRLQLHDGFTFADAEQVVPRLAELGISHLYLSPSLEAVPGSMHGYDVIDPTRIRASFGGAAGLRQLAATAHRAGLGLILDIVPNHVGLVSPANPWWWDVLAHGPDGRYGRHFDIHWQPGAHGQPTLLLPELGERLDDALSGDVLQLAHVEDDREPSWRVVYYDHAWPVTPGSLRACGLDPAAVTATTAACREDRERLRALLARQHYRLGYWRRANAELDHRRFFDIDTLGAVRVEDPEVFADVHAAVLPLIADGTLDGLRIDHPDGLADPVGYLHDLRAAVGDDTYIVVEKILEHGERFRDGWPVAGTVGYELAAPTLGVHLDPAAGPILDEFQARLTGTTLHREELVDDAKRTALASLFGAEQERVATLAAAALGRPVDELQAAIAELVVVWPVYRTYLRPGREAVDPRDRAVVDHALARAAARAPAQRATLDAIAGLLLGGRDDAAAVDFITAFQQLTGPAVAKGFEDTVLYRDLRCTAVNEVGADPGVLGASVAELHGLHVEVADHRPSTMRLSSSHDTKRSEDVRARLAVLAQRPGWWVATADRLDALAGGARTRRDAHPDTWPLKVHEHLAWQTAVGTWPIGPQRLIDYLVKAAREGKHATNWLTPDTGYEQALTHYAEVLTTDPALVAALEDAVTAVTAPAAVTALAMTLTKLTGPGVADTYQGTELWDRSLVDPDNRRPVDHGALAALSAELDAWQPGPEVAQALVADAADVAGGRGLAKLWVTRQALRLRDARPDLLAPGAGYAPLWARGRDAHAVWACVRGGAAVAIAPCRAGQLAGTLGALDLGDTVLSMPAGSYHDVLAGRRVTGGTHRVSELLAGFPVALYVKE